MEIDTTLDSLPVYEALASDTRLKIINLLADRERNIKEIAQELYMSSAIVTRHIKKLEKARIIKTDWKPSKAGSQKICSLAIDQLFVSFPKLLYPHYEKYSTTINLGHFTNFYMEPTCGLATKDDYIGEVDQPKYFMDPQRVHAELVWFTKGYVEYTIPNMLADFQKAELLEISLEISSEFPASNNNWPSDITFSINNTFLGKWTVPGNYSDVRGKLNPKWWPSINSQYGLLKTIRVSDRETVMDSEHLSNVTLKDIDFKSTFLKIKIAVDEDSEHVGGLTIFGENFGNHPQDIQFNLYYSENEK